MFFLRKNVYSIGVQTRSQAALFILRLSFVQLKISTDVVGVIYDSLSTYKFIDILVTKYFNSF